MIPAWVAIAAVAALVAYGASRLTPRYSRWFRRQRRPQWLTFERAIPLIWLFVFACGIASASLVWNQAPGTPRAWALMGGYLLVEAVTVSYTPAMLQLRRLRVGTVIGATGTVLGIALAVAVLPLSRGAFVLLLPYALWSPIGTYVTWRMEQLNPDSA
jgi:tryptophan-rich sensory protein